MHTYGIAHCVQSEGTEYARRAHTVNVHTLHCLVWTQVFDGARVQQTHLDLTPPPPPSNGTPYSLAMHGMTTMRVRHHTTRHGMFCYADWTMLVGISRRGLLVSSTAQTIHLLLLSFCGVLRPLSHPGGPIWPLRNPQADAQADYTNGQQHLHRRGHLV